MTAVWIKRSSDCLLAVLMKMVDVKAMLKKDADGINALSLESATETRALNKSAEKSAEEMQKKVEAIQKEKAELERITQKPEQDRTQAEQDWLILKKPIADLSAEDIKAKQRILSEQKDRTIVRMTPSEKMSHEDFMEYMKLQKEAKKAIDDLFGNKKIGQEQKSFLDQLWLEYPDDFDVEDYEKDEWIDYTGEGRIDRQVKCDGMTTYT